MTCSSTEHGAQQLSVRSGVESERGQTDGQTAAGLRIAADVNHQARRHVIGCAGCGDVTGLLAALLLNPSSSECRHRVCE